MRTVNVALGTRSYPIHIGPGLLEDAGTLLRLPTPRAVIVTNPLVAAHWLAPLRASLGRAGIAADAIVVADGEAHKSWAVLQDVLTRLLEMRAERATTLIALGGGVVGDLAGLAAALYQRGMPLVQVPTSLLAQVDSSVGGKTAVNHPLGKNMIGVFHQPEAVLIDTDVLSTLPPREFVSGLAEVIKYGAMCAPDFFAWLEQNIDRVLARDPAALTHAIGESCRYKAAIVARDERETGERALLNLGHTFAHAIEAGMGYGTWLHGEAVAAGMRLAADLSARRGDITRETRDRLVHLLTRAGLPVEPPALGADRYIASMRHDKKVHRGELRFILLRAIGEAYVAEDVRPSDLEPLLP